MEILNGIAVKRNRYADGVRAFDGGSESSTPAANC